MKIAILAGGLGTRLSEETVIRPKPLVEVGSMPILWHIMKMYSHYGFDEFIVCLGYKGYMIKEWFANYYLHNSDVTMDLKTNRIEILNNNSESWKVTLVETGLKSETGGRIKRIQKYVDGAFMLTYGDGLADINIGDLVSFHKKHGKRATVTAVRPPSRFGILDLDGDAVSVFSEKPSETGWLNGGFFVLEPEVFDYIDGDSSIWERAPLERLSRERQLMAYRHTGFWKPMDKLKDKNDLDNMWNSDKAPWKVW